MTNKFLSKGTPFRPEPGPPASTDHFLPDEGIRLRTGRKVGERWSARALWCYVLGEKRLIEDNDWVRRFLRRCSLPNRASRLALKPLRPYGFSAYQRYGQKSAIRSFFQNTNFPNFSENQRKIFYSLYGVHTIFNKSNSLTFTLHIHTVKNGGNITHFTSPATPPKMLPT
jgi:hypothetical protein